MEWRSISRNGNLSAFYYLMVTTLMSALVKLLENRFGKGDAS